MTERSRASGESRSLLSSPLPAETSAYHVTTTTIYLSTNIARVSTRSTAALEPSLQMQPQALFPKLPSEVRLNIYNQVLATFAFDPEATSIAAPGLLQVCRATRNETIPAYFRRLDAIVNETLATALCARDARIAERSSPESSSDASLKRQMLLSIEIITFGSRYKNSRWLVLVKKQRLASTS